MAERSDGRLPLIIVGGFLGAGKSTWLRHQLFERRFGRTHVLVNEAAELPVDDLLLGRADRLDVLAGGCACCTGRAALIEALRRLCDQETSADSAGTDTVILETSGLADPAAIARAIMDDPVLVRRIALVRTIVLADGRDGAKELANERLARAQIAAADEIIITKPGETDLAALSRLAATLRRLAPGAALSWAEFGLPFSVVTAPDAKPYDPPEDTVEATPIEAHRLLIAENADWAALSAWLSALLFVHGDRIVRVKGAMQTPAGRLLLQSVGRHVQPPEILPEPAGRAGDFIVLIGRGIELQTLERSWARFVSGTP